MSKIRVQKMLSDCGITSRRKAEEMIKNNRVLINGKIAEIGSKVDPDRDEVVVDGKKIKINQKYYIMLYKPRGYVCTLSDELGRKCITDLIKDIPERIYPVGRLDKDSEGLLLMTNDGNFANIIMHPSKHIEKKYRVTVKPKITEDQLVKLSSSMVIDGYKITPAKINVIKSDLQRSVLEIIICEGRNRQIRKMCEQVNLKVAKLKRVAIGPLKLGMLQSGRWRKLEPQEIKSFELFRH